MLDFLVARRRAAWWAEPGTGKTAPALFAAHRFLQKNSKAKILIASFKGVVVNVYQREAAKWEGLCDLQFYCLWTKAGQDACLQNAPGIYLCNWERLAWISANTSQMAAFGMVVIDESSALKNDEAKRTKLAFALAKIASVCLTMDGTPRPTGLINLFSQLKITDPSWVKNRAAFIREFCMELEDGTVVGRPEAKEHLLSRLAEIALVFRAEDVVGLPAENQITRHVTVPDHVHRQIETLSDRLATIAGEIDHGGGVVKVRAAVAVVQKIQQLLGGRAYRFNEDECGNGKGDRRAVVRVHDEKLEALDRLVNELNGAPLLVAIQFTCEADAIIDAIPGAKVAEANNFKELLPAWVAGEIPVLVANPASMGHGVDGLQDGDARNVCFFSPTWQSAKRQQFIARLRRGGQDHRVNVFDLIAEGVWVEGDDGESRYRRSIDEIMQSRVAGQIDSQEAMLKAVLEETRKSKNPSK